MKLKVFWAQRTRFKENGIRPFPGFEKLPKPETDVQLTTLASFTSLLPNQIQWRGESGFS